MEYYVMKQDKRYLSAPVITNLSDIFNRRLDLVQENASKISDINVGFTKLSGKVDFIDILDTQVYLVSERVKEVLCLYNPSLQLKNICILNNRTEEYGNYYIPLFDQIDCLSAESVVSADKSYVKKLVLQASIIEDYAMFKVKGLYTDTIVIRLDVAESLLRRKINKLILKQVELR